MTSNLEGDLRARYAAKAGELRLSQLEVTDLLAGRDAPLAPLSAGPPPRRGSTWMVAAALVAGATIGAGAIAVTRDEDNLSTGRNEVRQTAPVGPLSAEPGPFVACPEGGVPPDVADMTITNDFRVAHVQLPVTPEEWCVIEHRVETYFGLTGGEFDVYSSCSSCDAPTSSVAIVHPFENLEDLYENGLGIANPVDPVEFDVSGRAARFYGPDESASIGRFYVDQGSDTPLMLVGWGLDGRGMAAVAEAFFAADADPEDADVPGLRFVYRGSLGEYWPGFIPMTTTLSVTYGTPSGGQYIEFSTMQYPDQPPLEAYAWARPNPTFTTTNGRRSVTFPPSAAYAGTEQTTVISEVDDTTTVLWRANGTPPITTDELVAIELTPAAPDDPRWDEIAWESGNYDALG